MTRLLTRAPLVWQNGFEYVLQALALVHRQRPDIKYLLAGDGPLLEAVSLARSQLGISSLVEIRRNLTKTGLRRELRRTHVYLHVPVAPGAAVPGHVLKSGIPLVYTDIAENLPALPDSRRAVKVPRWNPEALAAAIVDITR